MSPHVAPCVYSVESGQTSMSLSVLHNLLSLWTSQDLEQGYAWLYVCLSEAQVYLNSDWNKGAAPHHSVDSKQTPPPTPTHPVSHPLPFLPCLAIWTEQKLQHKAQASTPAGLRRHNSRLCRAAIALQLTDAFDCLNTPKHTPTSTSLLAPPHPTPPHPTPPHPTPPHATECLDVTCTAGHPAVSGAVAAAVGAPDCLLLWQPYLQGRPWDSMHTESTHQMACHAWSCSTSSSLLA